MPNGSSCVRKCVKLSKPFKMKSPAVSRRAAVLLLSHLVAAVLCAQQAFSAETVRVGRAAQVIGSVLDVQFDEQLDPIF